MQKEMSEQVGEQKRVPSRLPEMLQEKEEVLKIHTDCAKEFEGLMFMCWNKFA